MLWWHVAAIALTFALVMTGFDWWWFVSTRADAVRTWMFAAVRVGLYLPVLLPLSLLILGGIARNQKALTAGWAIAQAEVIGGIMAAAYKAVTGRGHPSHQLDVDLTHVFRFGFLRGGVFWGWPSSHTTIAFAMAVTVFILCRKQKWLGYLALTYALYVGVGVSVTIHWFSDFIAGAIFGSVIGCAVGRRFVAGWPIK